MIQNRKFFKEMKDNPHLDIRYGKKNLSNEIIHSKLKMLLKETVQIFDLVHIPCIIMHGSLIGWYFGKQMLPWDDDIDIVILDEHREKLKTLHQYQNNKILIEVNPVIDTIHRDPANIIEARIICKNTGVFIDVTNLSKGNLFKIGSSKFRLITKTFTINNKFDKNCSFLFKPVTHKYKDQFDIRYELLKDNVIKLYVKRIDENLGWNFDLRLYGYDMNMNPLYNKSKINCFSPWYFNIDDIYPLRETTFENIKVSIPNNVENVLKYNYGNNVFIPYSHMGYLYKNGIWTKK